MSYVCVTREIMKISIIGLSLALTSVYIALKIHKMPKLNKNRENCDKIQNSGVLSSMRNGNSMNLTFIGITGAKKLLQTGNVLVVGEMDYWQCMI